MTFKAQILAWLESADRPVTAREVAREVGCSYSWARRVLAEAAATKVEAGGTIARRTRSKTKEPTGWVHYRITPEGRDHLADEEREEQFNEGDALTDDEITNAYLAWAQPA